MYLKLRFAALAGFICTSLLTGCGAGDKAATTTTTKEPAPKSAAALSVSRTSHYEGDVNVAVLSNGLTVVVKPQRRAPVVCVRAFVRAGGIYEGPWLGCGISHLTEHLVAQGAEHGMHKNTDSMHQPPDKVAQIGGQANAYTSLAHTCYYISANSAKTDDCVELIADWIARPTFDQSDFRREHGVVQRELEMYLSDPERQLNRVHMQSVFRTHPAAVPIIGYARPLSQLEYQDVVEYHRRMYVPRNTILTIVGDVNVEDVMETVKKQFADYHPGRQPEFILPEVPRIDGISRVVKTHPEIDEVIEQISFRTVDIMNEDLHALDVLSYILSNGRTSRLVKNVLREKKLVTSVSSFSWTPDWGAGVFGIDFRSAPGQADKAEDAVIEQLRRITEEGVTKEELEKAKRQKVSDYVRSDQTVESVSSRLGSDLLSTGNVNFSAGYTDQIQQVTAERVKQVARKYFDFKNMAITRLKPRPTKAATDTSDEPTENDESPRAEMIKLDNGLRVVLREVPDSGLVSMAMVSKGGVLLEDKATNGMGQLVTTLSTRGTENYTAEEIGEFFSRAGGGISSGCGYNSYYWRAGTLAEEFPKSLEIFSDVILHPKFPKKELEIIRPRLLSAIGRIDEDWRSQAMKFFRKNFFTGSPYALMPSGRKEVIRSATVKDISAWHKKHLRADSCVLAVYGQFDPDKAKKKIARLFGELPSGQVRLDMPQTTPGPEDATATEPAVKILKTDKNITAVIIAQPGMTTDQLNDRLAMDVWDTLVSGYRLPSGPLHNTLRGKRLVYVVHSYNWTGLAPGAFITFAACSPDKAARVADIITDILTRAAKERPTDKEIDRAVNTILTAKLLASQEPDEMAFSAAMNELYGLGFDFDKKMVKLYRNVTADDVMRVADKYLRSDGWMKVFTTPAPEDLDTTETQNPEGKKDESN